MEGFSLIFLSRSFLRRFGSLLLALIICSTAGLAGEAGEVWFGLHGGLSLPSLSGGTNELSRGYTSRQAPFFGLGLDLGLSSSLWLKAELNFSSQGGQRNGLQPLAPEQLAGLPVPPGVTLYANFNNETILDYLEFPLMLELVSGRRLQFFLNGGVYVGFRVRAMTVTSGTSLIYLDPFGTIPIDPTLQVPFEAKTDVSQEINRWNYGLGGGLGVKLPVASGLLVFQARFNYGLANIQSHPEITGENRSGGLLITAGYKFRL